MADGRLEVAALIHTANNLLLFLVAIIAGQDLSAGLDRSDGAGGPVVLIPMALIAVVNGPSSGGGPGAIRSTARTSQAPEALPIKGAESGTSRRISGTVEKIV